jgi:hypothetical protein
MVAEEIHEGRVSWKAAKLMLANLSSFPLLFCLGYLAGCVADETGEVFEMCESCFSSSTRPGH